MVFTSTTFLFLFFPLCMILFYTINWLEDFRPMKFLKKIRAKDLIIIAFSFCFYAWAGFADLLRLISYIILLYLFALILQASVSKNLIVKIQKADETGNTEEYKNLRLAVVPLFVMLLLLILYLVLSKYESFLSTLWNFTFRDNYWMRSLNSQLGISFLTFSAISYLVDIYRGHATAGSIIDCALYMSFFPKVISGPIVLWKDFMPQIRSRKCSLDLSIKGLDRIMIGFAKKLMLADVFGACIYNIGTENVDRITAAFTILLFMLQIYYDFSAYSDIALGTAKLFGFNFKENFNFPYRSKSITEFWRRWHISLGSWFREYVYIPLGGNRLGKKRTLINLFIVFMLTGIWHGAGKTYLLWGLVNAFFVILERVIQDKTLYKKTPNFIKYLFTMFVVLCFWQLFRFDNIRDCINWFGIVFGSVKFDRVYYSWQYLIDKQIIFFTLIGILGATLGGSPKLKTLYDRLSEHKLGYATAQLLLLALFVLSILFMVSTDYSPFIYFRY